MEFQIKKTLNEFYPFTLDRVYVTEDGPYHYEFLGMYATESDARNAAKKYKEILEAQPTLFTL